MSRIALLGVAHWMRGIVGGLVAPTGQRDLQRQILSITEGSSASKVSLQFYHPRLANDYEQLLVSIENKIAHASEAKVSMKNFLEGVLTS